MQSFFVRLEGWQTRRQIIVENGNIFFEIAEQNHCSICASRLRHVKGVVARKGLNAVFDKRPSGANRHDGYGPAVFVGLPAPENGEDPRAFIARVLDLPIILS